MRQQTSAIHASHKLLLVVLLLVAFCAPFIFAGASGNLSHDALEAGSGVLSNSQDLSPTTVRQTHHAATVSTLAGQSLVNVTLKQ